MLHVYNTIRVTIITLVDRVGETITSQITKSILIYPHPDITINQQPKTHQITFERTQRRNLLSSLVIR